MATSSLSLESLKARLRRLNLYGLLAHAEEILTIAGDSYRLKEAQERAAQRASRRASTKKTRRGS